MARSRLPDIASVPIVLRISVSEEDVARIDQVLARPEFAEWSRSEWCLEIIRTALRYYARKSASPEAEPAPAVPEARPAPAADSAPPASPPDPSPPEADELPPEPAGRPDCSHPQDARDYQTGTCAACGAILWD
jgi:pyruvate/2-oxoglutarate dehydrogenase complex dihydrolipoamide acyltransferase (E2) component